MDVLSLLAAATEAEHEHSQTAFLVIGSMLAVFAVAVAALGIARPETGNRVTTPVVGVGSLLVAGTMIAIVAVS